MVHNWSIRVKDRFQPHQNKVYFKWPTQEQHLNANVDAHLLSKLRNRINESKFKKFVALLKRKNLVDGSPIMSGQDFESFFQYFERDGRSHLPMKKLGLNLSKSDAAVFFHLLWKEFYEMVISQEKTGLGVVELFQLVIELFPNIYDGKAESLDRLSRKVLRKVESYRDDSAAGKTSPNIEAWLDWLKEKPSGKDTKT